MKHNTIYPILLRSWILVLILAACSHTNLPTAQPSLTQTSAVPSPTIALATPYALEPAAGICQSFDGTVVTITINVDMPDPRCAKVLPDQTLTVVNTTLSSIQVSIGKFSSTVLPGAEYSITVPFGEYLAVGVHQLTVRPCCGAELWLEAGQ